MEALIVLYAAVVILLIVSMWIIYTKAGQPGWASIVPIYNLIVFMRMINKPWWWILLWMIPYVNFIWIIWGWNLLVKKFGKSEGFTAGVIFLSFIFIPILAFGNAKYEALEEGAESSGPVRPAGTDVVENTLLIIVLFMFVTALLRFFYLIFHMNPYTGITRHLEIIIGFIGAFIPIVLGLVIKNKTFKIVCIVLGALYAIFMVYNTILTMKYMTVPY